MILEATITCPVCGTVKTEPMPTDACQFFYDCTGCGTLLRPKSGDCCVFCSFADVPCPPVQALRNLGSCRVPEVAAGSVVDGSPCHGQACCRDGREDG